MTTSAELLADACALITTVDSPTADAWCERYHAFASLPEAAMTPIHPAADERHDDGDPEGRIVGRDLAPDAEAAADEAEIAGRTDIDGLNAADTNRKAAAHERHDDGEAAKRKAAADAKRDAADDKRAEDARRIDDAGHHARY